MNYILNIVKSKALVLAVSLILLMFSCLVPAFAYGYNNIYALTDVSIDNTFLATLKSENVYILDVTPRNTSFSPFVLIDYDDLSYLVYRCNQNGVNASLQYNSAVRRYVAYVDDSTLFGRRVFGCIGNSDGSVYLADSTGTGSSISEQLSTIIFSLSRMIQTDGFFDDIIGYLQTINRATNNIQTKITSFFDGKTVTDIVTAIENITIPEVDNTDIIAALGRIETQLGDLNVTLGDLNITGSEFDDTDIINAIQNIPAYDDSGLISAVDNVSNIIVEQFGKNESQVNLPYIAGSASGGVRGVRLDSFESIDLASKSNVYVSESPVYRAGVTRNKTVVDDLLFSAAGASEPADMIGSLSFTEMVFTAVPTKAHPMVYTYSLEISKSQLDAFGVGYGDCIWRDITIPVMNRSCILYNARLPINGQTSTTYIASMEFEPRWDASGEWLGWCDDTDTVYESMGEPTRLYHHSEVDMSSGIWYLYSTLTSPYDVVYSSRFTAFLQAQFDRVVDASGMAYDDTNVIAAVNSVESALSNLSLDVGDVTVAPADLTPVITSIDAVGVNIEDLNANFNTSLGSLVDKLDVIVDKSSESVENLTVEISVDNEAHNVFYVTDEDGNEESLVDFSGDVLKAGGKLLNFLFKVCFDGAIDNLDGSIDDMDSFYFDGAELGGSLWE